MKWLTAVVLLALGLAPNAASARGVGVGVFGGANIPIVQDDNGSGSQFGVRVPVTLLKHLNVEPFFGSVSDGDASQTIGGIGYTRSGFDISSYGANVLFPFGGHLKFYPMVGLSTNKLTRSGSTDQTLNGFHFGLGLGLSPLPKLSVDLRGEAADIAKSGSGRTFANVTLGVSYQVFDFASHGGDKP
jgi:hypothetical protein